MRSYIVSWNAYLSKHLLDCILILRKRKMKSWLISWFVAVNTISIYLFNTLQMQVAGFHSSSSDIFCSIISLLCLYFVYILSSWLYLRFFLFVKKPVIGKKKSSARAKDCPGCGAVLPISTKECSHCDYQFTSKSMLMSQQSAIDESNTIREKFPFEPERVRTFIRGVCCFNV